MEDLWSRFGFRGLAFLLLALFALLRIGQLLFNLRMLKRQGLAGSYMAQAIVALVCAGGAFMLCLDPAVLGLEPEAPVPETTASVATVVRTQGLPPNVHFTGPLAPAKEAVQKDDWAALARIIFDDRRKRGGTPDTDFLLQWKAKPLGKEYLDRGRAALKLGEADTAKENLDYAVQLLSDDPEPALLRAETYPEAEWRSSLRDLKIAAERAPATDLRPVERRF